MLAARDAKVAQRFRIVDLPRLADSIVSPDSTADIAAQFHLIDGRCGITGQVTATLRMTCQRCLRPTDICVDDRFHVVLVESEAEMDELPDSQDSLIADAAQLNLAWLAEEQLLLAMPLVPLHAENCGVQIEPSIGPDVEEKQTPFAQLRELMKKQ
jgi:uncharacterized protein